MISSSFLWKRRSNFLILTSSWSSQPTRPHSVLNMMKWTPTLSLERKNRIGGKNGSEEEVRKTRQEQRQQRPRVAKKELMTLKQSWNKRGVLSSSQESRKMSWIGTTWLAMTK